MRLKNRKLLQICAVLCICATAANGQRADLQQGFTNRCEELCSDSDLHLTEDLKPDCQRGCQYFNIQFLISASDKSKVTDLRTTQTECKNSCNEAYSAGVKHDACNSGCDKMTDLQAKAPYINGWLVYMGASDRSMVLLQPDIDVPSEEDWILLDSVLRSNDYDKMFEQQIKMNENHLQQTMTIAPIRRQIDFKNCFPTWKWMILILLLLAILWMRYLTFLNITLTDGRENGGESTADLLQSVDPLNVNGGSRDGVDFKMFDKQFNDAFLMTNDIYFYPSPVVPPPKYDEAIESMLLNSTDDASGGGGGLDDGTDETIKVPLLATVSDQTIPKIVTTEGNSIKI